MTVRPTPVVALAAALAASLVLAACGASADGRAAEPIEPSVTTETSSPSTTSASPTTTTEPTTTTTAPPAAGPDQATLDALSANRLVTLEVAVADADQPTSVATRPGDPALYFTEVQGAVWAQEPDGERRLVLDLRGEVGLEGEQGMFSLDFSPDGRRLYASYTDLDGRSRVVELAMRDGVADRATWRDVFVVDQPAALHNGGHITVDDDGMLWFGLGDGGIRWDPAGNAQSLGTLLGKLLRVDPSAAGEGPYGIPEDNPFVGRADARGEIWAYGLRNPWRFSIDEPTGDVWVVDVGQYAVEEINRVGADGAGANFGWARLEGDQPVQGRPPPEGAVAPLHSYTHAGRCAVTGGYVYRGDAMPELRGAFLYADLCDGHIRAVSQRDGVRIADQFLNVTVSQPVSIQPDADGEPLVVAMAGTIHRMVPAQR